MTMSAAEICAEYRQAKSPMKQIQILADENGCTRGEIVEILRAGGEKLPGQYERGRTPEPEPVQASASEPAQAVPAHQPEPAPEGLAFGDLYKAALESIAELLEMADAREQDYQRFPERVRGVLMMLWKSGEQE